MNENLRITDACGLYLFHAVRWLNFLFIVGCISTALMLLGSLLLIFYVDSLRGITNLVLALIYVYPLTRARGIVKNTRSALATGDSLQLETAANCMRQLFKYISILVIILLVFSILLVLFSFGVAAGASLVE